MSNSISNVTNKVVVITGASSGIGEATARLLAQNGAKVVVGARRTERLEKLVEEIRQEGGEAAFRAVDVSDRQSVQGLIDFAVATYGRLDVLFNNAGTMPLAPLNAVKVDEWEKIIDVNVKGVLYGIAAALPLMEAQGSGHILNTASTGAHAVGPSCAVYCASKYAVRAITEGLRQETDKLRVTLISPGVTETELGHDITDEGAAEFLVQLRGAAISPDAIARAVLYAVSQPDDVDVSEMIVRPTRSAGHAF
jgi:NADP-dependent 3-hydroxy acid dehydrogenase YdfG